MSEAQGPVSLRTLALTFNQIALQSFGGGLSAWSREVIVHEREWLTDEEFLGASTICRILPGANQVNMAVFVGTRLAGWPGALASVLGLLVAPAAMILLMGALYLRYQDSPPLRHMLSGMAAAAAGLTFSVAWQQARTTLTSAMPIVLGMATLLLAALIRAPLWVTLLATAPLGFAWAWRQAAEQRP
jgi:chromate transporter